MNLKEEVFSDECDVMTVEEFRQCCELEYFIDYDGFGYWANLTKDGRVFVDKRSYVLPSQVNKIPHNVTHIAWYNR